MRLRYLPLAFLLCAAPAFAQTVPGPRVNLTFDQPQSASCENPTLLNAWNFTYGSCYRPAGVNLGDPWITDVRVTFTGAATVTNVVPRAQIVLETAAANCSSAARTPCLRINGLAAPAGPSNVTIAFIDGEDRVGAASTAVPFTGTAPTVPAATGLRALP
jgi:hypothetical protein